MGAFASDLEESLDSGQLHFHTWGCSRAPSPVSSLPFAGSSLLPGCSWSGPRVGRCRAGDTAKRQEVPVFHPPSRPSPGCSFTDKVPALEALRMAGGQGHPGCCLQWMMRALGSGGLRVSLSGKPEKLELEAMSVGQGSGLQRTHKYFELVSPLRDCLLPPEPRETRQQRFRLSRREKVIW